MGIWSLLFSNTAKKDKTVNVKTCILDASGLIELNPSSPTPKDNFEVLKTLTQFAAQEDLKIAGIFMGRALREAPEGSTYKNVKVYYAENSAARQKIIQKFLRNRQLKKQAVLITDDRDLERLAQQSGFSSIKMATLKKALDQREAREPRRQTRSRRNPHPAKGQNNPEKRSLNTHALDAGLKTQNEPSNKDSDTKQTDILKTDSPKKEILNLIDPI